MTSRVPPGLIRAAARAVAAAGRDMRDLEDLLEGPVARIWGALNPGEATLAGDTLGDLTDDELLDAAGVGATLEDGDGHEAKPAFGTPEWHALLDRRCPAKPDEWFYARARTRERGQNHTATAKEWEALAEWRRWRAEYLSATSPSERASAGAASPPDPNPNQQEDE